MKRIHRLILVSLTPLMLLVACASPTDTAKPQARQQVSCAGVTPRTGSNLVRKEDCVALTPQEVDEQQRRFDEARQNMEMLRARGATPDR